MMEKWGVFPLILSQQVGLSFQGKASLVKMPLYSLALVLLWISVHNYGPVPHSRFRVMIIVLYMGLYTALCSVWEFLLCWGRRKTAVPHQTWRISLGLHFSAFLFSLWCFAERWVWWRMAMTTYVWVLASHVDLLCGFGFAWCALMQDKPNTHRSTKSIGPSPFSLFVLSLYFI